MSRTPLAFVLLLSATPALAQPVAPESPPFSLGLGVAATVVPHRNVRPGLQARLATGLTRRFSLETAFDVLSPSGDPHLQHLFVFSIQGHYALSPHPRRVRAFITFGGWGGTERHRHSEYSYRRHDGTVVVMPARTTVRSWPPILPTGGVAVHYALTRRVTLRGDVQVLLCSRFDGLGSRTSLSAWFPIGR